MLKASKARVTGVLLIVAVSVIWIAASFIVQSIEDRLHPFLLTFLCNLLFLLYFPIAAVHDRQRCVFWTGARISLCVFVLISGRILCLRQANGTVMHVCVSCV